jgi:hypothetical protein
MASASIQATIGTVSIWLLPPNILVETDAHRRGAPISLFATRHAGARRSLQRYASGSLSLVEAGGHSETGACGTMSAPQPSIHPERITACQADTFASTSSSGVFRPAGAPWRYAQAITSSAPVMAHQAGSGGSSSPKLRHGPLAILAVSIYGSATEREPAHNKALQRTRPGGGHLYPSRATRRAGARR